MTAQAIGTNDAIATTNAIATANANHRHHVRVILSRADGEGSPARRTAQASGQNASIAPLRGPSSSPRITTTSPEAAR